MLDWISALAGPGATGWPGRTRCRPSTITLSPSESPLVTDAIVDGRLPELDPTLLGLVVGADDKDIFALLIRQHGGARDRQHLDRLHALQH